MQSKQGLVIILGCSHKGIINIVEEIIKKSGDKIKFAGVGDSI